MLVHVFSHVLETRLGLVFFVVEQYTLLYIHMFEMVCQVLSNVATMYHHVPRDAED